MKKRVKKIAKVVLWCGGVVLSLYVICFAVSLVVRAIDMRYGRLTWGDRQLSPYVEMRAYQNGDCRLYNLLAERYTTPRVSWVSDVPSGDSLAVYCHHDKRGYVNVNTGEIVIEAQYDNAWVFSEGVAAVGKGDKVGFIDHNNELVIPWGYFNTVACGDSVDFVFHEGYCVMADSSGLYGVIDKSGEWALEPQYDQIWSPTVGGFRVVLEGSHYGMLSSSLEWHYPVEYYYIDVLPHKGCFQLVRDGQMWQEDFEGNVVQSFLFDDVELLSYPVGTSDWEQEYALSDYACYWVAGRCGILNCLTGEVLTRAIYSDVSMLTKGLFEVRDGESGSGFLVDTKGRIVESE